jgi:hypothetical protein
MKPVEVYWNKPTAEKRAGKLQAKTGTQHIVRWYRGNGKPNLSVYGKGWGIFVKENNRE